MLLQRLLLLLSLRMLVVVVAAIEVSFSASSFILSNVYITKRSVEEEEEKEMHVAVTDLVSDRLHSFFVFFIVQ